MSWPQHAALATMLGEAADRTPAFPGIGPLPDRPIRLVLAPTRIAFDSITRGRLPSWSEGAAFPETGTIVILAVGHPDRLTSVARHELAHLALRWKVRRGAPLWFEEGYAAVAAREWGRLDALRLNWEVARGRLPDLDGVDRALRGDRGDAEAAYAFATSAVGLLERWGGERGLGPLIDQLSGDPSFEGAIRATYHITGDDFEERWQRDVRSHYGWLSWASSVGLFWSLAAVLVIILWRVRRRRYRTRRAQLDETSQILDEQGIAG